MSGINKYKPHLLVVPEDDANRQIVNGFKLHPGINARAIKVEKASGGWIKAKNSVNSCQLENLSERYLLIMVDFDGKLERKDEILQAVDPLLVDRVYVLGTLSEPEQLRKDLGDYETIGKRLAEACVSNRLDSEPWTHMLLKHNIEDAGRLRETLDAVLFI